MPYERERARRRLLYTRHAAPAAGFALMPRGDYCFVILLLLMPTPPRRRERHDETPIRTRHVEVCVAQRATSRR